MKEALLDVINNQLNDKNPICTYESYQALLEMGVDEDDAKELLIGILEFTIRYMLAGDSKFDEESWKDNLEKLINFVKEDRKGKVPDNYRMEKNVQRARKEFGYIREGRESEYTEELNAIETTLFSYHVLYNFNSKEARKVVLNVLNRLYGYVCKQDYDLFTEEDKRIYIASRFLEEKCNPYINDYVSDIVADKINLDHSEDKILFTPMILCLERVYRSIDFWNKKFGFDGYFNFLQRQEDSLGISDAYSVYTTDTLK